MKRRHTTLYLVILLLLLAAAILACNTSNMRAKDMPVWSCPTSVIPATHTMEPGWEFLTPPPPTYTPWPTETPYTLMSDFPLGKHVKIGGVGGIGIGIWVWLDNVSVSGPYEHTNLQTGETGLRWVAQWEVTVENASFTSQYEVYPFAQFYVFEIIEANGYTHTEGAWGISSEAHDEIGIPRLDVTNQDNVLQPSQASATVGSRGLRVAPAARGSRRLRVGASQSLLGAVPTHRPFARGARDQGSHRRLPRPASGGLTQESHRPHRRSRDRCRAPPASRRGQEGPRCSPSRAR